VDLQAMVPVTPLQFRRLYRPTNHIYIKNVQQMKVGHLKS